MTKQKFSLKHILILILFISIVSAGILYYQSFLKRKVKILETKVQRQRAIEISLNELKEGENKIGNVIVEKISPKLLYDGVNDGPRGENVESKIVGYEYIHEIPVPYYEFIYSLKDLAKVKMFGRLAGPGEEYYYIFGFLISDNRGNVVDERGQLEENTTEKSLEIYDYAQIKSFAFSDKVYFLIQGKRFKGDENLFFLYSINQEEEIKFMISATGDIDYGLKAKNIFYLKVGNEIWQFDENDILKNKFLANKIIVQNGEILFK